MDEDPRAMGRIAVARPKGAKTVNDVVNDAIRAAGVAAIGVEAATETAKLGRPPKVDHSFTVFSRCLKDIKSLDKTTQREVLALLNELLQ